MICQENVEALASTCIPIITKVAIVDEEKEADSLEYLRHILDQQFLDFIKNQFTQAGGPFKNKNLFEETKPEDEEEEKFIKQFNTFKDTLSSFAKKSVMYDPLERKIPKESMDNGINRDDLIEQISGL